MGIFSYRSVIVAFFGACVGVSAVVAPAYGQGMTKEQVRTRILDACVYQESPKRQESGGVVKICVCTAKAVILEMSEEEIGRYNPDRRMNRALRTRYGEALARCV